MRSIITNQKHSEEIFKLFMENYELKFSHIQKMLKMRSNKVSYILTSLVKKGILEKHDEKYSLTKEAEKYLPFLSNIHKGINNPLPVVLVGAMYKDKILLIKRKRRPYKNYWCMIGGKMFAEETIKEATLRLISEKSSLTGKYNSFNHFIHERVLEGKRVKHSFILFFTKLSLKDTLFKSTTGEELKWFNIEDLNKKEIVPSDYWLIKNKLNAKINLHQFDMYDINGKLSIKNSLSSSKS